jgi:hypothetical protein
MIHTEQTLVTKERLRDLERTVATLDDRLRTIQRGLQRGHAGSLKTRFWSLIRSKSNAEFMSAVCNQRIRSNTKRVTHEN